MLVLFSLIFVADTKITFGYNFVAPLIKTRPTQKWKICEVFLER